MPVKKLLLRALYGTRDWFRIEKGVDRAVDYHPA